MSERELNRTHCKNAVKIILVLALGLMVWLTGSLEAAPMGTAFTYQGRLYDADDSADGLYDFEFEIYDDPCTGAQQGATIAVNDLDVIDGYFTVELDFGTAVFDGSARWLQILVRPGETNDPNDFMALIPRQELTPTPYALQTRGIFVDDAGYVGIGTTTPKKKLAIQATRPRLALVENGGDAGVLEFHEQENQLRLQYWTDYGSTFNTTMMTLDGDTGNVGIGTITPGAKLDVEVISGPAATIGSSLNSATGEYAVAMGYNTDANGYYSTAMGLVTNAVGWYSTAMGHNSTAIGSSSTAMGSGTTASGNISTAMGYDTNASGSCSTTMGWGTTASGFYSTAMGCYTTASGYNSTAMGIGTTASGENSTAMGCYTNASGHYSTAMGREIEATGDCSVAIGLDTTFRSVTQDNTMAIMGGNVGIGTTSPAGKLDVNGSIYQRGTVLHADYVFEPDYELESIEEHSEYMWNEKHLPGIPKAEVDDNGKEIIEVGAHRRGIVEELEKAHIYIEQLHRRINELQQRNNNTEARLAQMETVVAKLVRFQEGVSK